MYDYAERKAEPVSVPAAVQRGVVGVVETGRQESRPGRVTITVTGAPVRT
jgi:hypothetical protein